MMHEQASRSINPPFHRAVFAWLLTGCALILLMVVVGGITRLTGSGLSITEWKLIHGTLPPMSPGEWNEEFENYKQIPQFRHLNYHFSLDAFKQIYWWEYIHRLLGRVIGMVFLVPFTWFWLKGMLDRSMIRKLLVLFALGGFQGFLGWYMVKSGLTANLYVSHYRLAIHLVTAFITFGYAWLLAMRMLAPRRLASSPGGWRTYGYVFLLLVMGQLVYGAFVAGLKAGYVYNTFPLMGDAMVPDALGAAFDRTGIRAMADDIAVVQFIHRSLAWILLFTAVAFFLKVRGSLQAVTPFLRWGAIGLLASVALQFTLGVLTILYRVPLVLGVAHQVGAFLLFGFVLLLIFGTYRHSATGDG